MFNLVVEIDQIGTLPHAVLIPSLSLVPILGNSRNKVDDIEKTLLELLRQLVYLSFYLDDSNYCLLMFCIFIIELII